LDAALGEIGGQDAWLVAGIGDALLLGDLPVAQVNEGVSLTSPEVSGNSISVG
jgi:hypothetical protein